MKYLYEFVGGRLNGRQLQHEEVEGIASGHSPYYGRERALGRLAPREELDGQPTVKGYLGPMFDGLRYEIDGQLRSDWSLTADKKEGLEPIAIIRYESQAVYDMLSH